MNKKNERLLFLEAIEMPSISEARSFIDRACVGDEKLRARMHQLLSSHESSNGVLDAPPGSRSESSPRDSVATTIMESSPLGDPVRIGPYRLMEQIGEGGFGLVYVAQQDEPVRRKVALKMVKPGMGSKEVIGRFEAERQALALMDHPCIAKVFDAGVTSDSRPFFVMELVRGVPITEFCDKAQLTIPQRLELFSDVCSAVHHAHQKGIIHRDLKPSNVLTTLYDDKPVVKVIDFGIAKAIGQNLTDKTIYTRFMSLMGTPLYMSPEQAELNGLDVDTRSDIYSLGVLLYELLTGTTPFDRSRMDSAGYNEIRKMILEEEPPKPSNRLSTLGQRLSTISVARQIEPTRIRSALKGDLDWIVMKAMSKDRTRRYDSAAALAKDIQCFLNSEPIEARPPSTLYRLGRFAKRNKVALTTASLVAVSLIAGTAASLYQMSMAISALNDKEIALRDAIQAKQEANDAKNKIEQFSQSIVKANLLTTSAQTHLDSNEYRQAKEDYSNAIQLQPSYFLPWVQRGQMYARLHLWTEAAEDFSKAISLGASTDQPNWQGIGAILAVGNQKSALRELAMADLKRIEASNQDFDWQSLRNCILLPDLASNEEWERIASKAESRIDENGPAFNFGRGRRSGKDPNAGPPFRGGPIGDEFRRGRQPGDEQRRDHPPSEDVPRERPPGDDFHRERPREGFGMGRRGGMPGGVQHYLVGLALLRAKVPARAITHFVAAMEDRMWPGNGLAFAPLAIAKYQTSDPQNAISLMKESDAVMNRWLTLVENAESASGGQMVPWFDVVEGIAVYREAAQLIGHDAQAIESRLVSLHAHLLRLLEE